MGIRGELFSTKITCEGRTYFFNVKQNRMGDVFLSIVESKPTEADTFDRRSIVVFREDMRGFLKAFQTTLGYMEKPGAKPTEMTFAPADGAPRRPKHKGPDDGDAAGINALEREDAEKEAAKRAAWEIGVAKRTAVAGGTAKRGAKGSAEAEGETAGNPGAAKKRRVVVRKKSADEGSSPK